MRPFYGPLPPQQGIGGYGPQGSRGGMVLPDDMPETVIRRHYVPAAIGSNETKRLIRVKKGQRVVNVSLRQGVSAAGGATSTWTIGDAATNNGYLASTSTVQASGTLIDGQGTYMTGRAGKVYTAVDDVNIYYTATGAPGATVPTCDIRLIVQYEWPEV